MKSDVASSMSYDEIKKTGYVGDRQADYLFVFRMLNKPMTHREATDQVFIILGRRQPARNGRIAELEEMGFLIKLDREKMVLDEKTGKMVNQWVFSGRTTPYPARIENVACQCCQGTGYVRKKVYRKEPDEQLQLL